MEIDAKKEPILAKINDYVNAAATHGGDKSVGFWTLLFNPKARKLHNLEMVDIEDVHRHRREIWQMYEKSRLEELQTMLQMKENAALAAYEKSLAQHYDEAGRAKIEGKKIIGDLISDATKHLHDKNNEFNEYLLAEENSLNNLPDTPMGRKVKEARMEDIAEAWQRNREYTKHLISSLEKDIEDMIAMTVLRKKSK